MEVRPLWHHMIVRALPDGLSVKAVDDLRRDGTTSKPYAIADGQLRVQLRRAATADLAERSSPLEEAA